MLTFLENLSDTTPVLIAGPTASGKSSLALRIAESAGGRIINADALQVFADWRSLTARPDAEATARLADIGLERMGAELSADVRADIDLMNPMRVLRAWEVARHTGRSIREWQAETPPPLVPLSSALPLVIDAPKEWLTPRIERRFGMMLKDGALEEARAVLPRWDPTLNAAQAIGAPELIAHLKGEMTLAEAREAAIVATRRYAKRQRTWFRARMGGWTRIDAAAL